MQGTGRFDLGTDPGSGRNRNVLLLVDMEAQTHVWFPAEEQSAYLQGRFRMASVPEVKSWTEGARDQVLRGRWIIR